MDSFAGPPGPDILVAPVTGEVAPVDDGAVNGPAPGAAAGRADGHLADHAHPDHAAEAVGPPGPR